MDGKLNRLLRDLPEGLVVDSAWLRARGYSTSLCSQYVSAGWLERVAGRVYRRPRGELTWRQVVISLQTLLGRDLVVGGRTALELQGFAHYLTQDVRDVHLYGDEPAPTWLDALSLGVAFHHHARARLFDPGPAGQADVRTLPWGQWNMVVSTPERAVLELLDELPARESFHQVDMMMEGLSSLSPKRLKTLIRDCRSVKAKRLFFYFADRHPHPWRRHLSPDSFDLGSGKRMLVKGGRLDARYRITVPRDLDAVS